MIEAQSQPRLFWAVVLSGAMMIIMMANWCNACPRGDMDGIWVTGTNVPTGGRYMVTTAFRPEWSVNKCREGWRINPSFIMIPGTWIRICKGAD